MTEAELQEHVRAACKQLGLAHFHVRDSRGMEPGFPDSVIISPRGHGILYRELKSAGGTLTPAQKRAGRMLAANHCDYAVWRPADWLRGTIARQLAGIAGLPGEHAVSTGLFEVAADWVAVTNDDWYTPPWIFSAAAIVFDMDVAAPVNPDHRTCPARRYLTPVDDGLAVPWEGAVWMNPPFSNPRPWVEKWARHPDGLALLPASKSAWLGDLLGAADAMTLITADFLRPAGASGTFPSALVLAGQGACIAAVGRVAAACRYARGAWFQRGSNKILGFRDREL